MHKISLTLLLFTFFLPAAAPAQRLLVRGDDMGSFHAANCAVIECYTDGIMRSTEVMTVTPWLPEAARLLNRHPRLDAGLHLTLTSEWDNVKWRPLTGCASLTDSAGFFLPMTFPNTAYPGQSLAERLDRLDMREVERELRAQIELAKRMIPHISHLSAHMAWHALRPDLAQLAAQLGEEYGIPFVEEQTCTARLGIEPLPFLNNPALSPGERERLFIAVLAAMKPGRTYLLLDHPAYDSDEMRGVYHTGNENVAADRQQVRDLFTSSRIRKYIAENGIELIGYGDLLD